MQGPRYIRHGECARCGWCCEREECGYFKREGGFATCGRHGNGQPEKCVLYPEVPPLVSRRCGFWFVDTFEENRVIRPGEI